MTASTRALTMRSSRKSQPIVPGTRIVFSSRPRFTSIVRMPRFCRTPGAIATPPALTSSAYFGTISMPMEGDLPGLSKCWSGTIGSYQYSTLRSPEGGLVPVDTPSSERPSM